ncbi:ProQ/FinO family protein [Ancylobacter polymorphus]|uniref:SRNA-binding protein n=1 Tax=Ancylobacter polymorphus TaxID=223390 RepID=A0ABU0BHH6_9HYPH|nr:ProQ/FinO family protein [Ancylobacter polymorphus]MDQ0305293.1 sRNA-binding protein [Ancylobacter polymorphus]
MSVRENRKAKWRKRKSEAEATRSILVQLFPRCFRDKGQPKQPLKTGIYHDIRAAAPQIPARKLGAALHDYTSGRSYLRAMTIGASRVDLEGWPVETVAIEHAKAAREQIEHIESQTYKRRASHAQDRAA